MSSSNEEQTYCGSAERKDVLERLEQSMKGVLQDVDYEPLPSGGLRWQKEANFARYSMVKKGLLKAISPRGKWEITEVGRRSLRTGDS